MSTEWPPEAKEAVTEVPIEEGTGLARGGAAANGTTDGLDQPLAGLALRDETDGPGFFGGAPCPGIIVHGEHHDAGIGVPVAEDRGGLNALLTLGEEVNTTQDYERSHSHLHNDGKDN